MNTFIGKSLFRKAPSALAHDPCIDRLFRLKLFSRNECHRFCNLCTGRYTEVRGDIRFCNHCFSILFASCEPACPSMGMGKHIFNLFNFGIDLHGKSLRSDGKSETEKGPDTCKKD